MFPQQRGVCSVLGVSPLLTEQKTIWSRSRKWSFCDPRAGGGWGQPQSPTYLQRLCVQFLPP